MVDFSAKSLLEYEEIVRNLFASEDEGFEFYNKYAFDRGFSVRKTYVEWDDAKTEIILRKFVCSRQGFREEKYMNKETKRRPRDISRVGCQAKLDILEMQYGGYDNVACTSRDLYNFCYRYKHETIAASDAETVTRHLKTRQEGDPEFFFKFVDASNSNNSTKRKQGRPKKNDKTSKSVKGRLSTASIANRVQRPKLQGL